MAHSIVTSVATLSETRPLPSLDPYVEPQTVLNIGKTFLLSNFFELLDRVILLRDLSDLTETHC